MANLLIGKDFTPPDIRAKVCFTSAAHSAADLPAVFRTS